MMDYQHFIVVGDTVNEEKYAYKIKHELLKYSTRCRKGRNKGIIRRKGHSLP